MQYSPYEICDKIISNHGEDCETYKLAALYQREWNKLVEKYSDGINTEKVSEENIDEFDEKANEYNQAFKVDLLNCYLSILQREYDYFTSEEQIIETIEANEYTFTESGKLEN